MAISREAARAVLDGKVSLASGFVWKETPQGHDFWATNYVDHKLSEEGRAILESIAYDEPVAVVDSNGKERGKFKVGDRVRALESSGCGAVTKDTVYKVTEVRDDRVHFINDMGRADSWDEKYFALDTLALREGGYYRTRDGCKVGPAEVSDDYEYPWRASGELYLDNGRWLNDNIEDDSDIIAEWTDADEVASCNNNYDATSTTGFTVPLEAPEFGGGLKVGDRVNTTYCVPTDNPGTVTAIINDKVFVRWDKYYNGMLTTFRESELRLVAEATSGNDEPDAKLLVTISADTSALDAEIDRVKKRLKKLAKRARKLGIDLEYSELRDAA